jgi:hypothetical protein
VQLSGVIGGRAVASNLFTLPAELAVLCDLENSPRIGREKVKLLQTNSGCMPVWS